jgi:hypothetical protein
MNDWIQSGVLTFVLIIAWDILRTYVLAKYLEKKLRKNKNGKS